MAKSMVERYEQLLVQDPASSVFVELAKALLEKGDHERAIDVCVEGLRHHPSSVAGRVLWGKALIHRGRPAEAMAQFDLAIGIDKENPHAYNLISEVLLQRGLYRSALPLLRKAALLKPNDGRIQAWLEQTQQALAGGPAPSFEGFSAFDALAAEPAASAPVEAAAPVSTPAPASAQEDATQPRAAPVIEEDPDASERTVVAHSPLLREGASFSVDLDGPAEERTEMAELPSDFAPEALPPEPPTLAGESQRSGMGVTDTKPDRGAARRAVTASGEVPVLAPEASAAPAGRAKEGSRSLGPPVLYEEPASDAASASGEKAPGLLGLIPEVEDPSSPTLPRATSQPSLPRTTSGEHTLLEDIPELVHAPAPPKAEVISTAAAARIAGAYERELREKIAETKATPSFWSRHGAKLSVGLVVLVVVGVGLGVFVSRRARQGGQTLGEALEFADRALGKDTLPEVQKALVQLERALEMDEESTRAWALIAYARALLFADHGGSAEERLRGLQALGHPGVREQFAGLSLVVDYLLAEPTQKEAAKRAVLAAKEDSPELLALAGRLLLENRSSQAAAVERFKRALALNPRQVRSLVDLGRYYQDFGDARGALRVYSSAQEASPEHPAVLVGLAESRLALDEEVERSQEELAQLNTGSGLSPEEAEQVRIARSRVLSALGKQAEARTLLVAPLALPRSYDLQLGWGAAQRAAGQMDAAQRAYEAALSLRPKAEEALEGLGRALLDRDRPKDALARLRDVEGKKVALVRGAAQAQLGDWKRARQELLRTRVNERYPAEAVIHLALADAAEGEPEAARKVLEKALTSTKKAKSEVRLALGTLLLQQGNLEEARVQFTEAATHPQDYEAPCALGRLLVKLGQREQGIRSLQESVSRNASHGEAREALGRALLAQGKSDLALKEFEAWQQDTPSAVGAQKGLALAYLASAKRREALAPANRAVKLNGSDPEARRVRAISLFGEGDSTGGFGELEKANKLDPQDPLTFCEIGQAFARQGRLDNAGKAFGAARRVAPQAACGLIGEHAARVPAGGKPAVKALQTLAQAPSTAAQDKAFAWATLAQVQLGLNALKEAKAAAEEALKLSPSWSRAYLALGQVAQRQKQESAALTAFAQAVALEPTDGAARLAYAELLARSSAPESLDHAVKQYEAFLRYAGGSPEVARVKRILTPLKRRLASR